MKCTLKKVFLSFTLTCIITFIVRICVSTYSASTLSTPTRNSNRNNIKTIFYASSYFSGGPASWKARFPSWGSYEPVQCFGIYNCQWTDDSSDADALVFHLPDERLHLWRYQLSRKSSQQWIVWSLESPMNYPTGILSLRYNLTATFMRHSNVWTPYFRYTNLTKGEQALRMNMTLYDPSEKAHFAFVVVSNCKQDRMDFLQSFRSHINIHIYGQCGQPIGEASTSILQLSRSYRYYLSFENSLCRDYITEKFWKNGLQGYSIPVAHGGLSRRDYENVAPPGSFIHTRDFRDVRHLGRFLKYLADNETAYSHYFEWKRHYKVVGVDSMCEICRKLHTNFSMSPLSVETFWDVDKNCVQKYNHFE